MPNPRALLATRPPPPRDGERFSRLPLELDARPFYTSPHAQFPATKGEAPEDGGIVISILCTESSSE